MALPKKNFKCVQILLAGAGVCKTRTGYLRMADADGKMRIEKCGQHKADGKMLINQKTKNKTRKSR